MWNSNSLTAWLLARSGHHPDAISMPAHGRAPGWSAGLIVVRQDTITGVRSADNVDFAAGSARGMTARP